MSGAITPADGFFDPGLIPWGRKLRDRHTAAKIAQARGAAGAFVAAARRGTPKAPRTLGRARGGRPRARPARRSNSSSRDGPSDGGGSEPPGEITGRHQATRAAT